MVDMVQRLSSTGLVWLATVGAIVWIGVAASPLPEHFRGISGLPPPQVPSPEVRAAAPLSIEPIIALAPFGRVAEPATPAPEVADPAAGLTLHGVIIATARQASSAIISRSSSPAQVYGVGQGITDAVSLDAVFADHVVVRISGREETLTFPEPGLIASGAGAPAAAPASAPAPAPANAPDDGFAALRALLADAGSDNATSQ